MPNTEGLGAPVELSSAKKKKTQGSKIVVPNAPKAELLFAGCTFPKAPKLVLPKVFVVPVPPIALQV